MIAETAQAATDVVRSTGSLTGQFVLDGAILIAILKVVETGINKFKSARAANSGRRVPLPGETDTCREHGEAIAAIHAEQKAFKESTTGALVRIETKVDAILARGGK